MHHGASEIKKWNKKRFSKAQNKGNSIFKKNKADSMIPFSAIEIKQNLFSPMKASPHTVINNFNILGPN